MTTVRDSERRTWARHALNFSVNFASLQEGGSGLAEEEELAGTDLSLGGLGVVGATELKPGTKMMLKLKLGDEDEPLLIPAKVMWSQSQEGPLPVFLTGMKFIFLSDEGNLRIQNFVVKASLMNQYRS